MKLKIFEEARLQFRKENAWWRENRDAKTLFAQEFLATIRDIQKAPGAGGGHAEVTGLPCSVFSLVAESEGG